MPNYLSDLKLPLEPTPTESEIFDAIKKRRTSITSQANQGRISPETKKKQLAELEKIEAVMRDPQERTHAIAAELKAVLDSIRKSIATLQLAGIDTYTKEDLEIDAKRRGISAATVERVYKENGFHEDTGAAVPVLDVKIPVRYNQESSINGHIQALWTQAPESAEMVNDLYSFMAYYSGLSSRTVAMSQDDLVHMDRKSLSLQVEEWAGDCAINRPRNALTTALNNLLADCQKMLESEDAKKAYHVSMLFMTCQALKLVDTVPKSAHITPKFADARIKEIAAHFHADENVALAIYNDKIKPSVYTPQAPYRPTIQCPNCNQLVPESDGNGRKILQCPSCKADLYVKCRCGNTVPAVTDSCTCGRRIFDMRHISGYAKSARLAIKQNQFALARQLVNQIYILDDRAVELKELNNALQSFTEKQNALYRELDQLCNAKKYYAARAHMQKEPELATGYSRKAEIEKSISEAEELKKKYGIAPTEEQANSILLVCADVPGVTMPNPKPARNVRASYNMYDKTISVSWMASESASVSDITYDVHRQVGGKKPEFIGSGRIANDLNCLNYVDKSAPSGKNVWYYVVAKRSGKSSDICSITIPVKVLHEVDDSSLIIRTDAQHVHFVWTIPNGAQGVRILRNEIDMKILPGMTNVSVDAVPGKPEKYVFQAYYEIDGVAHYTPGITRNVAPTSLKPIKISIEEQYNGRVKLVWPKQTENAEILFILTSKEYTTGDEESEKNIRANAVNNRVYNAQVSDCVYDLGILPIGSYQIVGFINISGVYKACTPVAHSNTPKINTKGITYDRGLGTRLILRNVQLPKNASGVVVFLNSTKVSDVHSPGGIDVQAADLVAHKYSINLSGVADNATNYVTLYVYYDVNGKRIYGNPSVISISTKEREKITCTWEWTFENVGPLWKRTRVLKGALLKIEMPADSEYCPAMKLVGKDSLPPRTENEGSIFMNIDEVDEEQYEDVFSYNTRIIQFTAAKSGDQVSLRISNGNGIILRQNVMKQGYQLKMFVSEINYEIGAVGTWSVP